MGVHRRSPGYAHAMPFSEGLAAVCDGCVEIEEGEHRSVKGGKWGFIDRRGEVVIPLRFSEAGNFENGRARVRTGANWHFIGKNGEVAPQDRPGGARSRK